MADGEARPQGSDQLAFGSPPQVGDALYLGFEEPLDRLIVQIDVDASQARGAGVNPEDPPLRWEVSQADGEWAPATVLEDLTGGFNYGSGHGRARAAAALGRRPARRAAPALAALPDRRDERSPAARARPTRTRRRSTRSPPRPMGARLPATHAARIEREILGVSDGTPGQIFPLRHQPVLKLGHGRDARGPGPGVRATGRAGSARPDFVGSTEFDRHFVLDLVSRRGRARPGDPRDARRLDAVRRGPAQGRGPALHALPPRRRPRRQRHGRHAERAQEHDRRHRHGDQPGRRRSAASTPRSSPTRASARRWRSARATARSPPRTSSSWPARRARAWRAPSASRRATAAPCRCTSSRASTRPTGGWTSPS